MNSIIKTLVFSQTAEGFAKNGQLITGLLQIETASAGRLRIRAVVSNTEEACIEKCWLTVFHSRGNITAEIKHSGGLIETQSFPEEGIQAMVVALKSNSLTVIARAGSNITAEEKSALFSSAIKEVKRRLSPEKPFYKTRSAQLYRTFSANKPYIPLIKAFRNAYWVKIVRGNAYYAEGIVLDGNEPRYLCFALPERYMEKTDEMFTYFIPDGNERGYFIAFQDAASGTAVRPDISALLADSAL